MRLEYGLLAGLCQDMARRVAREEHFLPVAFQHRRYLIAHPLNLLENRAVNPNPILEEVWRIKDQLLSTS